MTEKIPKNEFSAIENSFNPKKCPLLREFVESGEMETSNDMRVKKSASV